MHTTISCATCTRLLRIPSDLLGQTVRCPYCIDAFTAVADPTIKQEEKTLDKPAAKIEQRVREPVAVAVLEPEPPVVEEEFTVDLQEPARPPAPAKPWTTKVYVKTDSDRRLWGEMQAEIGSEGVRLYRGRKELIVPVGCEATWIGGSLVRVVVGNRTVEFQLKKRHIYKSRLAADLAGFLNGDRPMPVNKGYGWPWHQWLLLLLPLGLLGVLIVGELPDTSLKWLKGFGIFMLAVLAPLLAYVLWHMERLRVGTRWTGTGLLVGSAYLFAAAMYMSGPRLPPAADRAVWSSYRPPAGRYSINMPAPPIVEYEQVNDLNFVMSAARVKPNQTFTVLYTDLLPAWDADDSIRRGLVVHSHRSIRARSRSAFRGKLLSATGPGQNGLSSWETAKAEAP